jgi:hypothetical protein
MQHPVGSKAIAGGVLGWIRRTAVPLARRSQNIREEYVMCKLIFSIGSAVVFSGMLATPTCFAADAGTNGAAGANDHAAASGTAQPDTSALRPDSRRTAAGSAQPGTSVGAANNTGGNPATSGNTGTGNPLGASPGGSNPLGTTPPGTSPLGSSPGGSNPLGSPQHGTQGGANQNITNTGGSSSGTNSSATNGNNGSNQATGTATFGGGTANGPQQSMSRIEQERLNQHYSNGTDASDPRTRSLNSSNDLNTNNQGNIGFNSQSGLSQNQQSMNQNNSAAEQDWRQVYYDNHWWYYGPNNNWLYYDNNRWNPYASQQSSTNLVPNNSSGTGSSNGQYGVGYHGDTSLNGTNQNGTATSRSRSSSRNSSYNQISRSPRNGLGKSAVPRPNAPSETELRAFEQQNFGNSATGINSATDRVQGVSAPSASGTGVDSAGVPNRAGQP